MSLEAGQEELGGRRRIVRQPGGGLGVAVVRPTQRPWTGSRPTGGGWRQPKTRRRPTAAAGPPEAPDPAPAASRFSGVRAAASRLPAREATGATATEGGNGDVGWWRRRRRGFGRSRRRIPAGWSSGGRTGSGGKGKEVAVGRSRAAAGFGPDAPRDVNLHREVLYFTSREGRGPIFLHMDRLLKQRFLFKTV